MINGRGDALSGTSLTMSEVQQQEALLSLSLLKKLEHFSVFH